MRVGTLFAGIGGFELSAEWMGWENIWSNEIFKAIEAHETDL